MKKFPTKKDIRAQIDQQVADYLDHGGTVADIPRGVSGRDANVAFSVPFGAIVDGRSERTPIPEVIKALDERKHKAKPKLEPTRKPRRVLIYDDFGEPLRWEWKD